MQRKPRKPPFDSSNANSYHRKDPPQPSERRRPGRPGVIDQRLRKGAQNARNIDQFHRDNVERYSPEPEYHTQADDEMELDAFGELIPARHHQGNTKNMDYQDLELLSQPDKPVRNHQGLSAVDNAGRHSAFYQPESRSENPPTQTSRFFNCKHTDHPRLLRIVGCGLTK